MLSKVRRVCPEFIDAYLPGIGHLTSHRNNLSSYSCLIGLDSEGCGLVLDSTASLALAIEIRWKETDLGKLQTP